MYRSKFETLVTIWFLIASFLALLSVTIYSVKLDASSKPDIPTEYVHTVYLIVQKETKEEPVVEEPMIDDPQAPTYTEEEIKMIAKLTMAEAGNQSELGKRLVIDTVLNRVEHENPQFPDTVKEVIYQKNQYSPIWDGRFDKYYASEENIQLVREEIERRTDHDVIFFRTTRYSDYGVPLYCVGDHYFSSFD